MAPREQIKSQPLPDDLETSPERIAKFGLVPGDLVKTKDGENGEILGGSERNPNLIYYRVQGETQVLSFTARNKQQVKERGFTLVRPKTERREPLKKETKSKRKSPSQSRKRSSESTSATSSIEAQESKDKYFEVTSSDGGKFLVDRSPEKLKQFGLTVGEIIARNDDPDGPGNFLGFSKDGEIIYDIPGLGVRVVGPNVTVESFKKYFKKVEFPEKNEAVQPRDAEEYLNEFFESEEVRNTDGWMWAVSPDGETVNLGILASEVPENLTTTKAPIRYDEKIYSAKEGKDTLSNFLKGKKVVGVKNINGGGLFLKIVGENSQSAENREPEYKEYDSFFQNKSTRIFTTDPALLKEKGFSENQVVESGPDNSLGYVRGVRDDGRIIVDFPDVGLFSADVDDLNPNLSLSKILGFTEEFPIRKIGSQENREPVYEELKSFFNSETGKFTRDAALLKTYGFTEFEVIKNPNGILMYIRGVIKNKDVEKIVVDDPKLGLFGYSPRNLSKPSQDEIEQFKKEFPIPQLENNLVEVTLRNGRVIEMDISPQAFSEFGFSLNDRIYDTQSGNKQYSVIGVSDLDGAKRLIVRALNGDTSYISKEDLYLFEKVGEKKEQTDSLVEYKTKGGDVYMVDTSPEALQNFSDKLTFRVGDLIADNSGDIADVLGIARGGSAVSAFDIGELVLRFEDRDNGNDGFAIYDLEDFKKFFTQNIKSETTNAVFGVNSKESIEYPEARDAEEYLNDFFRNKDNGNTIDKWQWNISPDGKYVEMRIAVDSIGERYASRSEPVEGFDTGREVGGDKLIKLLKGKKVVGVRSSIDDRFYLKILDGNLGQKSAREQSDKNFSTVEVVQAGKYLNYKVDGDDYIVDTRSDVEFGGFRSNDIVEVTIGGSTVNGQERIGATTVRGRVIGTVVESYVPLQRDGNTYRSRVGKLLIRFESEVPVGDTTSRDVFFDKRALKTSDIVLVNSREKNLTDKEQFEAGLKHKEALFAKAERLKSSVEFQVLADLIRSDPNLKEEYSSVIERIDEFKATQKNEMERHRAFTGMLTAIMMSPRLARLLDVAIDETVRRESNVYKERIEDGENYVHEVVIGAGPHSAIYNLTRQMHFPGQPSLTADKNYVLGGQFAQNDMPIFRLNSRTRPELRDKDYLPGTEQALNTFTEYATMQPADTSGLSYSFQNAISENARINLFLSGKAIMGVELNKVRQNSNGPDLTLEFTDTTKKQIYKVTTDRAILTTGLGVERTGLNEKNKPTQEILAEEREKYEQGEDSAVMSFSQAVNRFGDRANPYPLQGIKRVVLSGSGDGANVIAGILLGYEAQAGKTMMQLDKVEEIIWIGQDIPSKEQWCEKIRTRYHQIGLEFPREKIEGYYHRIKPVKGKAERLQRDGGNIIVVANDGSKYSGDHYIYCHGFQDNTDEIVSSVYNEKVTNAKEISNILRNNFDSFVANKGNEAYFKRRSNYERLEILSSAPTDSGDLNITYRLVYGSGSYSDFTIDTAEGYGDLGNLLEVANISRLELKRGELPADNNIFDETGEGRSSPIALKYDDVPIFKAGPASKLELTEEEIEAAPVLKEIPENTAAIFRYAKNVSGLAHTLARVDKDDNFENSNLLESIPKESRVNLAKLGEKKTLDKLLQTFKLKESPPRIIEKRGSLIERAEIGHSDNMNDLMRFSLARFFSAYSFPEGIDTFSIRLLSKEANADEGVYRPYYEVVYTPPIPDEYTPMLLEGLFDDTLFYSCLERLTKKSNNRSESITLTLPIFAQEVRDQKDASRSTVVRKVDSGNITITAPRA